MIDIYTCITAQYDDLKKQPPLPDARYTAFVEGVQRPQPPWTVRTVLSAPNDDATRRAREAKVRAHVVLPEAEVSLWVDGCFVIRKDFPLARWVREHLAQHDLVTFVHPTHLDTTEHADYVIKAGLDRALTVAAQVGRYEAAGLPRPSGMVQTNVVLRRHTEAVKRFNELWWQEIQAGSRRDQLSFVYAAREAGLSYRVLPTTEQRYFEGKSHRGARAKP